MPRENVGPIRSAIERRALDRHGVILRSDALTAGMTPAQVDRRVRRGQWVVGPGRGVLLLAAHGNDPLAKPCAATLLIEGSNAHGRSALALWGLVEHPNLPTVVTERQRRVRGVAVTTRAGASAFPTTRRRGIPTVTLEVAVASLAPSSSVGELHRLIDEALRRKLTTTERVLAACELVAVTTRSGRSVLRQLIDERTDAVVPRPWGPRHLRSCSLGLATPVWWGGWLVSCLGPGGLGTYGVARWGSQLPLDGETRVHDCWQADDFDLASFENDRRRDIDIGDQGWIVDRITWRQYVEEWDWILGVLRRRLGMGESLRFVRRQRLALRRLLRRRRAGRRWPAGHATDRSGCRPVRR
ncbi:MAG: type IV toxin-antitoxin system AbiEi family antitoxin domain-containing protein [Acidimicrobiales bacterium]